jgi:hypothetical protein
MMVVGKTGTANEVAIFVHLAEGGNLLGGAVLEFLAR